MSIKDQVNPEQWKALLNAPGAASTYVSTASGGGFDVINEVFTASRFAKDLSLQAGGSGYGPLVDELLAAMKSMTFAEARDNTIKYQSKDPAGIRAEVKQFVTDAVKIAEILPDVAGYKRWILDMVRKVAETRTGGFLGFGGRSVIDEKEQAALDELKTMFGM
jgi:hypothetical protein